MSDDGAEVTLPLAGELERSWSPLEQAAGAITARTAKAPTIRRFREPTPTVEGISILLNGQRGKEPSPRRPSRITALGAR
jgi:hypothetical protein